MGNKKYIYSLICLISLVACNFNANKNSQINPKSISTPSQKDTLQKTTYILPGPTYSLATIAPKNAQMIYVSGINAYGKNGPLPLEEQLQTIFKKLNKILKEAGSKPECITMIKQYTTRMDNEFFEIFLKERGKFLKGAKPSSALIPMAKPNKNSIDIEIELVCYKCD